MVVVPCGVAQSVNCPNVILQKWNSPFRIVYTSTGEEAQVIVFFFFFFTVIVYLFILFVFLFFFSDENTRISGFCEEDRTKKNKKTCPPGYQYLYK